MPAIVLFNNDLRVSDNQALINSCKQGKIIPVFIFDESIRKNGSASNAWLYHALKSLNDSLNGKLIILKGDTETQLLKIIEETNAKSVFWNRVYEPNFIDYFGKLKLNLQEQNINVFSYNSSLLIEPSNILKKDETPYKVFTPFYKNVLQQYFRKAENYIPGIEIETHNIKSLKVDDLCLLPKNLNWHINLTKKWDISEQGAQKALKLFIKNKVEDYKINRDFPNIEGTSLLSAYLHFGQISPNQILEAIDNVTNATNSENIECYISEIIWREFSYYLLFHFKDLPTKNFNKKFDNFKWQENQDLLKKWQQGQTGIPIVDAGMRQLYQTGYMHNRVRMIVASLLVKNMLINWQEGLKWFEDCLFDSDMASNSASWQWVAGTGADAAPYFRVFNPILQSERFDKSGEYIKKYVPELNKIPAKYIHEPSKIPDKVALEIGFNNGIDYPYPIINLKQTRELALEKYQDIK